MGGKHNRFTIILCVLIAICIIILATGLVVYQHQDQQVQQLKADYDRTNADLKAAKNDVGHLEDRQKYLDSLTTQLGKIDTDLMDYSYIPTYLHQIEDTAKVTGNELRAISPHPLRPLDLKKSPINKYGGKADGTSSSASGSYQVQQISLDISGSYVSLIAFLDALRNFPKIVYVRTINLSPHVRGNTIVVDSQIDTYAIITPEEYKKSSDELSAGGNTAGGNKSGTPTNSVVGTASASLKASGKAGNMSEGGTQ